MLITFFRPEATIRHRLKPDWTPCEVYSTHYSVNITILKQKPTNLAKKKIVERQFWEGKKKPLAFKYRNGIRVK